MHDRFTLTHSRPDGSSNKGYFGKIVRSHEENGYILRKEASDDAHSYFPYLADNGKKRVEELIREFNEKIRIIMKDLSDDENKRLADGFNTITAILIREKG